MLSLLDFPNFSISCFVLMEIPPILIISIAQLCSLPINLPVTKRENKENNYCRLAQQTEKIKKV